MTECVVIIIFFRLPKHCCKTFVYCALNYRGHKGQNEKSVFATSWNPKADSAALPSVGRDCDGQLLDVICVRVCVLGPQASEL